MIPEKYWILIKRWYWLIGAVAILGAVMGALIIPAYSGATSEYHASVTLGIRRVISPAGSTTGSVTSSDLSLLADYTSSVAARAKTPQFASKLHSKLALEGIQTPEISLRDKYSVTDDRGLSRVTVDATSGKEASARAIADAVSSLLIEDVTAEESRLRENLSTTLGKERTQLLTDLGEISSARLEKLQELDADSLQETIDNVVRRGIGTNLPDEALRILSDLERISGDPELAVLASRERAIQEELNNLASIEQGLAIDVRGDPVVILSPVTTAESQTLGTRARDAAMLGLIAGTVLGWIAANVAEANQLRAPKPRIPTRLVKDQKNDEWKPEAPRTPRKKEVAS